MTSKLAQMQARFQQKQMQEREEKLLKLYESQQQRTIERMGRGSAGSNTSIGSTGAGKVRQMFDQRRNKAGVDKSYPLEPLKGKTNPKASNTDRKTTTTTRTTIRSTVANSVTSIRNGKPVINKREVVHGIYNNNNGDETYEVHRFEDDNSNIFDSKSDKVMIELMNNHNLNDTLDNEEMPKIGFDEVNEVDEVIVPQKISNSVSLGKNSKVNNTKRVESKSTAKSTPSSRENNTVVRKTSRPSPTTPPKTSPRTATPPSPAKTPSSAGSNAMNSKGSKTTPQRAPAPNRPSAKQQPSKTSTSAVSRDDLSECNYCGRRFATDRIQKHEDICSKTGKKKRKAYDATKHRVMGTELESYILKPGKGKMASGTSKAPRSSAKKDWRRTHEEFIATIRAAKEAQAHVARGGNLADLPPPPPSSNPDYVQCPHCNRRFNESAAERHIPKCANFQFNKPKPGATSSKSKGVNRR